MPVYLIKPYLGQAAGTLFFGPASEEAAMRANGIANDMIEQATDYEHDTRTVTGTTATVVRTASTYKMNSATAQTLTIPLTGYFPVGKVITVEQLGAGAVTVAGATGVTVTTKLSSLVTGGQYSIGQLIKTGPATWNAFGGFGG